MPPFEDQDTADATDTSFDDAFKQFAEPGKAPVEEPTSDAPEPAAEDDGPPADEALADSPPAEDAPAGDTEEAPTEADEGADEGDVEVTDTPEDTADDADQFLKRLKGLLKEAPAEAPPTAGPEAPAPETPPMYTAEEQQILDEYDKEWPEVARAERLRRREEYNQLVKFVFEQVSGYFQPVAETVETLAMRAQLADIQDRAPDYADIRDGVIQWIDTQPAYLQAAYKNVMQQGTAEEVTDLLDRYRAEAQPAQPVAPTPKKKAEPSATVKQAAKSMAPVSTKRSVVPDAADDMNDFDAAFKKFAAGQS